MNLNSLQSGFLAYLEEQNKISKEDSAKSDVYSVLQTYGDEFLDWIVSKTGDSSVLEMNFNDIKNMLFEDGKLTPSETLAGGGNLTLEALNDLFENEEVIKALDKNQNGAIDEDEMQAFLEYINKNDGNVDKFTFSDIKKGVEQIKTGELTADTLSAHVPQASSASAPATSSDIGSAAATGAASSVEDLASVADSDNRPTGSLGGVTCYAGMTEEELQKKLDEKEEVVENKQEYLSSILDGTDSSIKLRQDSVDNAYDVYMRQLEQYKVNQELIQKLDGLISDINNKENEISAKEQEISNQETTVSNAETALENATATVGTLEAQVQSISSAMNGADEEEAAFLSGQLAAAEAALEEARAAEAKAKEDLALAKTKLEQLKGEKETLEGELEELNSNKDALEAQIVATTPDVQYAMKNYNKAKENYTTFKTSAIERAKTAISTAQEDATEIKNIMSDNKQRDLKIEYSSNQLSKEIIEYAKTFLGYNALDGSADIFLQDWHASSNQDGWCSAFCDYIFTTDEEIAKKIPEWFKNIENPYYQVNVYNAAQEAGAVVDVSQVEPGDLVVYDYNGDGHMQHIAIVAAVEDNMLITIDGNSGKQVRMNQRDMSHPSAPIMKFLKITGDVKEEEPAPAEETTE